MDERLSRSDLRAMIGRIRDAEYLEIDFNEKHLTILRDLLNERLSQVREKSKEAPQPETTARAGHPAAG